MIRNVLDLLNNNNFIYLELNLIEIQDKFPFYKDIDISSSSCVLEISKITLDVYKNTYKFLEQDEAFYLSYSETNDNLNKYTPGFMSIKYRK